MHALPCPKDVPSVLDIPTTELQLFLKHWSKFNRYCSRCQQLIWIPTIINTEAAMRVFYFKNSAMGTPMIKNKTKWSSNVPLPIINPETRHQWWDSHKQLNALAKHMWKRHQCHTCSPSRPMILGMEGPHMSTSSTDTWQWKHSHRTITVIHALTHTHIHCKAVIGLVTFSTHIVIYLILIRRAGTSS